MLIVGAKGFAKEVLEVCLQFEKVEDVFFFDDINLEEDNLLFDQFSILRNIQQVKLRFDVGDCRFTMGIGNPFLRNTLSAKFIELGGLFTSTISTKATVGKYGVSIGDGSNILDGAKISNSVVIGKGAIVYYNAIITHDCIIGDFVEISPGATLLGRVEVGNFCQLGSGSIILPNLKIGNNVTIGAGAVVTQDIPNNAVAVGVPAKIIKFNKNE